MQIHIYMQRSKVCMHIHIYECTLSLHADTHITHMYCIFAQSYAYTYVYISNIHTYTYAYTTCTYIYI